MSIIIHFVELEDSDSSEARLVIGMCVPAVYDPEPEYKEIEKMLEESEAYREFLKRERAEKN